MNNNQLRTIIGIGIVIILIGIAAYIYYPREMASNGGTPPAAQREESDVRKVAEDFGRALKNVSLLAPEETLAAGIRTNYSPYLTPSLIDDWANNPDRALGREVSSPWPDRIEIAEVEKSSDEEYKVTGQIIEVDSTTDVLSGGAAARRDIDLTVRLLDGRWLISAVTAGDYRLDTAAWQEYENSEAGFKLRYPRSLGTNYISIADASSPSISVASGPLRCEETAANSQGQTVSRRNIGGREFCVSALSEGAAGSTYTEYTYATELDGRVVSGNFTLRYPQCLNYDDPERALCQRERERFDLDGIIGQMVDTYERNQQ